MECDRYLELLALDVDGELSGEEKRELEAHMAVCPDCRAAGAQLAALRGAFPELEEDVPPEGFAQGVMDRIRAEEAERKVVPLFKRPQFRALAGLAACLVVVAGLYSASRPEHMEDADMMLTARSFSQDAVSGELEDTPQIAAYAAPEAPAASGETTDGISLRKINPDGAVLYSGAPEDCTFQNDQYLRMTYNGDTLEPEARIIGSAQSLEAFLSPLPLDAPGEIQARYDETYFETGRLLAVVMEEPSGSIRHQITQLTREQVVIEQISPYCTEDMAAWLILAEVDTAFSDSDELEVTVIPWEDSTD